ncbi:hypothetical protein CYY_008681 [Polysphondylium violaceum]|uniref:GPI inositol-deacylase n=1 Tax=Polysphondylium violaceum TaxID=133409 RepID=A0A8J4PMS1_9MYCE|nr:hypothetical protein CYY_008681 [Polysphondylium violaceum]
MTHIVNIPKYPIVLCHGLFGFHQVGPFIYFRNIINPLKRVGVKVEATTVHPTDSIKNRSFQLYKQINSIMEQYNTDKVHIVAHSMGGLDSRYLISQFDQKKSVLSLTTLGTPHRGSYIAEWCNFNITERLRIEKILKTFGIPFRAIQELSPTYVREVLNETILDSPNVFYSSYGAYTDELFRFSPLTFFHKILLEKEGKNDGLVSLESAKWGQRFQVIPNCDHRDLINWSFYDATPIYFNIVNQLYCLEKELELSNISF